MRALPALPALVLAVAAGCAPVQGRGPGLRRSTAVRPVPEVASGRLTVKTPAGQGVLPVDLSADWSAPLPDVRRALVVLHGRLRNADTYFRTGLEARGAAGAAGQGTLVVAPQFLDGADVAARGLSPDMLRWSATGWEGGDPALGPAPLSSFDALDAVLARLGDSRLFPNLEEIVVAGHSGGAQVAQRYAVLGHAPPAGAGRPAVRFVVANPSSYVYMWPERPGPVAGCAGYDDWKYGLHGLPPYAAGRNPATLESAYAARDVTYLLGGADTDPEQSGLDRSCAGEAQGPYRLARGMSFVAALRVRHPDLRQAVVTVPGVGHDGRAMFTSPCGLAVLFRAPGCG